MSGRKPNHQLSELKKVTKEKQISEADKSDKKSNGSMNIFYRENKNKRAVSFAPFLAPLISRDQIKERPRLLFIKKRGALNQSGYSVSDMHKNDDDVLSGNSFAMVNKLYDSKNEKSVKTNNFTLGKAA